MGFIGRQLIGAFVSYIGTFAAMAMIGSIKQAFDRQKEQKPEINLEEVLGDTIEKEKELDEAMAKERHRIVSNIRGGKYIPHKYYTVEQKED